MIPLFKADGTTRLALTYNGLTLNQEVGSKKDGIFIEDVLPLTVIQTVQEAREFDDGLEVYPAYKRAKRFTLTGEIAGSTFGALLDRVEAFAAAVDPSLASHNNPDTSGFLPFDFNVPTADLANWPLVTYPTGIPCRYYARAEKPLEPTLTQLRGLRLPFQLPFIVADPRRYLQSQSSLDNSGTADNSLADYWSWPTVVIAMAGAGSATFAITNGAMSKTLTLNLSGTVNGDSISIDMGSRAITKNGVAAPGLYALGDWWWMEPGSNAIILTNPTNASVTTTWRSAFSF